MKKNILILLLFSLFSCTGEYYNVVIKDIKCSKDECILRVESISYRDRNVGIKRVITVKKQHRYKIGQQVILYIRSFAVPPNRYHIYVNKKDE